MLSHVSVEVTPKAVQLNAGDTATVTITVANTGPLVDAFQVSVDGLDRSWYQITAPAMRLDPNSRATASLAIKPPKACATTAKSYPVVVRVESNRNAGQDQLVPVEMTVLPFYDFAMALRPQKISGPRGVYQLNLNNQGNAALNIGLTGTDPEELCRFQFDPQRPNVLPCEQKDVRLVVTPLKRPMLGRPKAYRFNLTGTPDPGTAPPKTAPGELEATAKIPAWIKAIFSFPFRTITRLFGKGKRKLMMAAAVLAVVVVVAVVIFGFVVRDRPDITQAVVLNPGQELAFGFQVPKDNPTHLEATVEWKGAADVLELAVQQPDGRRIPALRVSAHSPTVIFTLDPAAVRQSNSAARWIIFIKNVSASGQADGEMSLEFLRRG